MEKYFSLICKILQMLKGMSGGRTQSPRKPEVILLNQKVNNILKKYMLAGMVFCNIHCLTLQYSSVYTI